MSIETIKSALAATQNGNLLEKSKDLLSTLGYRSDLILDLSGSVDDFFEGFPHKNPNTKTEQHFRENAKSVQIIFQFTKDEIVDDPQLSLLEPKNFDKGNTQCFLFCAVELKNTTYSRTKFAEFTREINKRLNAPTVILFRTGEFLTIAFADRRPSKTDETLDVLGQVTLIKDIRLNNPHRAHLDILSDLSLEHCIKWMDDNRKPQNFDGLLAAWLAKLDTEELNKQFYRRLFTWYEWAVGTARFPTKEKRVIKAEEHVIRLITRLLFIWFIKEKGLVAEELFNKAQTQELLVEDDFENGDSYYRAVLQNLFFATLNTEIAEREFSEENYSGNRNFSRYRYKKEMSDPNKLLALFAKTPFINGGLFDCLDSFEAPGDGGYRIDCFSDVDFKKLSIPNRLFFDAQQGLIPLLEHYKFTVEENTPIDQEVALDPELLGRVFENLLAAINPETGETARKMTGSYYTPRAIVDYMVEETLVAALSQKCQPTDGNETPWEERLRSLFDYAKMFDDESEWFDNNETDAIVKTISELKILDPAVGSGAFPMGTLHKLTLALRRLDPDNIRWETLQKEIAGKRAADAFNTQDQQERDAELTEISDTFERYRDSDFGRKLYLIQNSIFGVDIQPIACQIAKLRFFISLAIEQQPDRDAENFGIKPLPNLETRFVAANTLIGINLSETKGMFQDDTVQQLLKDIDTIREKFFLANNRGTKRKLEKQEEKCRTQLENELERQRTEWIENRQTEIERKIAMARNPEQREQLREKEQKTFDAHKKIFDADFENARKIAQWKPYDQNAKEDWFDPEWMYGVKDGFDITIGNPPYVRADRRGPNMELRQRIKDSKQYQTLYEKWDLFIPFIECSYKMLNPGGFTTLIVSDAYCHAKYAIKSQEWFLRNGKILRLDFLSKIQIFDAAVKNVIYLFQKADGSENKPERRVHENEFGSVHLLPTDEQQNLTQRAFFPEDSDSPQFSNATVTLDEVCYISYGLRPNSDPQDKEKFVTSDVVSDKKDHIHCKPFVVGEHIDRWLPKTNLWIEWGTDRAPARFYRPTFPEMYTVDEKILIQTIAGSNPITCYDNQSLIFTHSCVGFFLWHDLSQVRNRSIQKQARYSDEKPKLNLPKRENLEETSRRFSVKFLIGVMNSSCARDFLLANRRSNLNLYPDDWKQLPIPDVSLEQQTPIIELVNKILDAKRKGLEKKVNRLEKKLDMEVSALYGVEDEE